MSDEDPLKEDVAVRDVFCTAIVAFALVFVCLIMRSCVIDQQRLYLDHGIKAKPFISVAPARVTTRTKRKVER